MRERKFLSCRRRSTVAPFVVIIESFLGYGDVRGGAKDACRGLVIEGGSTVAENMARMSGRGKEV